MILQFTVINTYDTQAEADPADLGVAPVPHADDQADSATISYSNAIMLTTKDAAKQEAAKKFLTWLLEPQTYGRFLTMEPGLFLPVTNDGAEADSFWKDPVVTKYKSQVETMVANSKNGKLFGFTTGKVFPSIGAVNPALTAMANSLRVGDHLLERMGASQLAATAVTMVRVRQQLHACSSFGIVESCGVSRGVGRLE